MSPTPGPPPASSTHMLVATTHELKSHHKINFAISFQVCWRSERSHPCLLCQAGGNGRRRNESVRYLKPCEQFSRMHFVISSRGLRQFQSFCYLSVQLRKSGEQLLNLPNGRKCCCSLWFVFCAAYPIALLAVDALRCHEHIAFISVIRCENMWYVLSLYRPVTVPTDRLVFRDNLSVILH